MYYGSAYDFSLDANLLCIEINTPIFYTNYLFKFMITMRLFCISASSMLAILYIYVYKCVYVIIIDGSNININYLPSSVYTVDQNQYKYLCVGTTIFLYSSFEVSVFDDVYN